MGFGKEQISWVICPFLGINQTLGVRDWPTATNTTIHAATKAPPPRITMIKMPRLPPTTVAARHTSSSHTKSQAKPSFFISLHTSKG